MVGRRDVLAAAGTALGGVLAGCTTADETPTAAALSYTVEGFEDGTVPVENSCDGAGTSPRIDVEAVPPPTESLAIVFTFPDDVASQVTLWTLWNVPPDTTTIPADLPATRRVDALDGARQGRNARGDVGYLSVCPPPGQPYEQWLTLYACRRELDVEAGAPRDPLAEELETATLASKRVVASYERRSATNTTSS